MPTTLFSMTDHISVTVRVRTLRFSVLSLEITGPESGTGLPSRSTHPEGDEPTLR